MSGYSYSQSNTGSVRRSPESGSRTPTSPSARNKYQPVGSQSSPPERLRRSNLDGSRDRNPAVDFQAPPDQGMETSPIYTSEIGREIPQFTFSREEILKGLIYSELLGKPKSKRTHR